MAKNEVESFYDSFSQNYANSHSHRFVDKIFDFFIYKYLPKHKKMFILDAGGGIGRFSIPLAQKDHTVCITDISQKMLNEARKISKSLDLKNISFIKESITNMNKHPNSNYDVVLIMNGVLDYCGNHKKALKELHNVMRSNGILIGTVNNRYIYATTNILLDEKSEEKFRIFYNSGDRHKLFPIHDFTLNELKKELAIAGFTIIKILGPTNLLRKWEFNDIINEDNENGIFNLQIEDRKSVV